MNTQAQVQLRNPWSFGVEPRSVTYGVAHTVPTEAEAAALLQAAEWTAVFAAEKTPTYKLYLKVAEAAKRAGHDSFTTFRFSTPDYGREVLAYPQLLIDGVQVGSSVEIKSQYSRGSSMFTRPNGKSTVSVRDYPNGTSSFPQKADGSFSYDKIANTLIRLATRTLARKAQDTQVAYNGPTAAALIADLAIPAYGALQVSASASPDRPVLVRMKIDQAMTCAQVARLAAFLKSENLL